MKNIYRSIWFGKEWDPEQKIWKFEWFAFLNIIKRVLDYLSSNAEPYILTYAEKMILDVLNRLKNIPNYRQTVLNDLPKCKDEYNGYCNHAGGYFYGDRIKCIGLDCNEYISPDTPPEKIIEIITKLHLIHNEDYLKNNSKN